MPSQWQQNPWQWHDPWQWQTMDSESHQACTHSHCSVDRQIWDCLQINKDVISQFFAEQGVTVSGFKEWFCRSRGVGHVAINVGVVRFARLEDPCFKLYRLRVFVFKATTALMFVHKSSQGLFCEFTERKYVMSKAFTAKFHERATKAVNEKFGRTMKMFEGLI